MDGEAWWATVLEVAKSWTRLSDSTYTYTSIKNILEEQQMGNRHRVRDGQGFRASMPSLNALSSQHRDIYQLNSSPN